MLPKRSPHPKTTRRFRVLIADDVLETRRANRVMLGMIPYVEVVAIAHNGLQAVKMAQTKKPDIAVMDINMPELDGLSAIWAMRERNPRMAFVVISAEKNEQTVKDAESVGACEFLMKPYTFEELERAIKTASQLVIENHRKAETNAVDQRKKLLETAEEYIVEGRTDGKARVVLEQLAESPNCEKRWLMYLATLYLAEEKWGELKVLAARLEQR